LLGRRHISRQITGYGSSDGSLKLDLVHNPAGAYLPGYQTSLKSEYRWRLRHEFGVSFNTLFSLVNCPIRRYLDYLKWITLAPAT
jgi:hypothetical protein